MEEGPTNPMQTLFADPTLEEQLSDVATEAFGTHLHLSRFPGGQIDLYVGTPENQPSVTTINQSYLDELRNLPTLGEQGDGMRSFIGVMLAVVTGSHPIMLIDEPERPSYTHHRDAFSAGNSRQKLATFR
jgi:hypothetical protein